jgi:hypothetical protein
MFAYASTGGLWRRVSGGWSCGELGEEDGSAEENDGCSGNMAASNEFIVDAEGADRSRRDTEQIRRETNRLKPKPVNDKSPHSENSAAFHIQLDVGAEKLPAGSR